MSCEERVGQGGSYSIMTKNSNFSFVAYASERSCNVRPPHYSMCHAAVWLFKAP